MSESVMKCNTTKANGQQCGYQAVLFGLCIVHIPTQKKKKINDVTL